MYHSIDTYDKDPHSITVTPQRFQEQMDWLCRRGFKGVAMAEMLTAEALGGSDGLVALTFDDGYEDFLRNALPVLEKYEFTATVYVVVGGLGASNTWDSQSGGDSKVLLSGEQIQELASRGIEIGSHSLTHRHLTDLGDADAELEIAGSRSRLEELIGTPVDGFCYPYGSVDRRISAMVERAGYRYACATKPEADVTEFKFPRCFVGDRDDSLRLALKRIQHQAKRARYIPAGR